MANQNIQLKSLNGEDLLYPITSGANVKYADNSTVESLKPAESGAQVNVIETVQVNGTDLTVTDKKVNVVIPDAAEYTIAKKETAETGYAATYNLTKDGTIVGASINIPKDMVIESGEVKTCTEDDKPVEGLKVGDKYIDLKLANADDKHIYIPVKDLVDVYTAGDGLSLSGNEFSAKLTTNGGIVLDSNKAMGVSVDDSTVALSDDGELKVKAGGITNTEVASALKSTSIAAAASASDDKLATEKAVRTELDTKVDKVDGSSLMTSAEHTKLAGIAENAQVNVIETVKLDGTALTVTDKAVDVALASTYQKITDSTLSTTSKTVPGAINEVKTTADDAKSVADAAVVANSAITGATHTKITYDSKGLVTAGSDLTADDIPSLTLAKISDVTATASEVNVLDGITATTTELNYVDGVTSSIQTQLDAKLTAVQAGSNVSVDTTSATQPKVSVATFAGTNGTSAGTTGVLSAPATTDANKFLKSDGSWVLGVTYEVVTSA